MYKLTTVGVPGPGGTRVRKTPLGVQQCVTNYELQGRGGRVRGGELVPRPKIPKRSRRVTEKSQTTATGFCNGNRPKP